MKGWECEELIASFSSFIVSCYHGVNVLPYGVVSTKKLVVGGEHYVGARFSRTTQFDNLIYHQQKLSN